MPALVVNFLLHRSHVYKLSSPFLTVWRLVSVPLGFEVWVVEMPEVVVTVGVGLVPVIVTVVVVAVADAGVPLLFIVVVVLLAVVVVVVVVVDGSCSVARHFIKSLYVRSYCTCN